MIGWQWRHWGPYLIGFQTKWIMTLMGPYYHAVISFSMLLPISLDFCSAYCANGYDSQKLHYEILTVFPSMVWGLCAWHASTSSSFANVTKPKPLDLNIQKQHEILCCRKTWTVDYSSWNFFEKNLIAGLQITMIGKA